MIGRGAWLTAVALLGACSCEPAQSASPDGAASDAASDASQRDAAVSDAAQRDGADVDASVVLGCGGRACDLLDNGCDAGLGCYYFASSAGQAPQPNCAAAGDNPEGARCASTNDCAPGFGCGVDGRCASYCCDPGTAAECPLGQSCTFEYRDNANRGLGVGLCQRCDGCNPVDGAGCADTEACYPVGTDGSCRVCVRPARQGDVGDACVSHGDCRAGLGCVGTSSGRCTRFCDTGAAQACSAGQTCAALGYTSLPTLGICQ